jgi:hypothetical protein
VTMTSDKFTGDRGRALDLAPRLECQEWTRRYWRHPQRVSAVRAYGG